MHSHKEAALALCQDVFEQNSKKLSNSLQIALLLLFCLFMFVHRIQNLRKFFRVLIIIKLSEKKKKLTSNEKLHKKLRENN